MEKLKSITANPLLKSSALIAFFTILSQLLGLLRDRLLINNVGIGLELDIYNGAFRIPDLVYAIMMSYVAATTVIPLFSKSIKENDRKKVIEDFSSLFTFFSIVLILIAIFVIATIKYWIHLIFPTYNLEQLTIISNMIKILMLQPLFLGISNLISCLAQAYKRFLLYAIAPLFYNLGIIFGVMFFYKQYGIYGLAYGVVLGSILHLTIQSIFLFRENLFPNFSFFSWYTIKRHSSIASLRSLTFFIMQLKNLILTFFANLFGAGVLSSATYAKSLINMSVSLLGVSYSVASFPDLTTHYESREIEEFKKKVKNSILGLFIISSIVSVILFVLAKFTVNIIYGNYNTNQIIDIFKVLLIGLPFFNIEQYMSRVFMAMKKVLLNLYIQIFSILFQLCLLYYFYINDYGFMSLAYSLTISIIIETTIMFFFYKNIYKEQVLK